MVELDGRYDEGAAGEPARQRAYRSASWFLLQQCDLLIAAFDPDQPGAPGGTEETVKHALYAGIPVLWIDLGAESDTSQLPVRILTRRRDLDAWFQANVYPIPLAEMSWTSPTLHFYDAAFRERMNLDEYYSLYRGLEKLCELGAPVAVGF